MPTLLRLLFVCVFNHRSPSLSCSFGFVVYFWNIFSPNIVCLVALTLVHTPQSSSSSVRNWNINPNCITCNERHHTLLHRFKRSASLEATSKSITTALAAVGPFFDSRPDIPSSLVVQKTSVIISQVCHSTQRRLRLLTHSKNPNLTRAWSITSVNWHYWKLPFTTLRRLIRLIWMWRVRIAYGRWLWQTLLILGFLSNSLFALVSRCNTCKILCNHHQ